MKRILYIFLTFITLFYSCDTLKKKKYTILLHSKDKSLIDGTIDEKTDSTVSEYDSDSSAYFSGKLRFEISVAINKEFKTEKEFYDFEVLNDNRENIKLKLKSDLILELDKRGFLEAKKYKEAINGSNNLTETKQKVVEETPEIKELKKKFKIKTDEFDKNNLVWYEPKTSPTYRNANGFYCYFGTKNGIPTSMRIVHQYYSDDWLFIGGYKFSIDDKAYSYIPSNMKTDNGDGGMIWEWSDEEVDTGIKEIITALINSKSAKIRLEGKQYYDTKNISSSQIKSIKETVTLYKLMGGNF